MSMEGGRRRWAHTARGAAQVSISSYRQRVGGDKLPSIKSWKVDVPLDTAAACGTGWERAGKEVGMWSGVSQGTDRPVATFTFY